MDSDIRDYDPYVYEYARSEMRETPPPPPQSDLFAWADDDDDDAHPNTKEPAVDGELERAAGRQRGGGRLVA